MSLIPSPDQRRLNSTIEALREDKRQLQDENKRLRDSLSDCLTLLTECSYDATEVTEKARKLLNQ